MSNYLIPGEVRCWSCGKWMSNNELENADGCCPFCDEEIHTNEPPYTSDSEQGGPMNDITALSPVTPEMLASLKLSAMNLAEGEMMSFEPAVFRALVEALESRTVTEPQNDYFASLVAMARVSADKAMRKFPQPNYVLLKVAEEAGEVVQAGVHYAEKRMEWQQVEGEIVQLLAMLIRLVTEGDQINGITPPAAGIQVVEGAQTE